MSKNVAVLVYQDTKRALADKSFDHRGWIGLSVVCDVLRRNGIDVGFVDAADSSGKILLASVTGASGWYDLVRDLVSSGSRPHALIVGGAGVNNVRPFLGLADHCYFVLGRGEGVVAQVVAAAAGHQDPGLDSVVYNRSFSIARRYRMSPGVALYPHSVELTDGQRWRERACGCRFRCSFCMYTWTRNLLQQDPRYGTQINERTAVVAGSSVCQEHNLCDLVAALRRGEIPAASRWYVNSAIDGQSERIRRAIKKPVTRDMLRAVARMGVERRKLSLMTVVGFPTETASDRAEAIDDIYAGLLDRGGERGWWGLEISPNIFRPQACTPAALWPAMLGGNWTARLLSEWKDGTGGKYRLRTTPDGVNTISMSYSAGSDAVLLSDLIVQRGTEADAAAIVKMAQSRKFWASSAARRIATIEKYFDVDALTREYSPSEYPVRYLEGHTPNEKVWAIGAKGLAKLRATC